VTDAAAPPALPDYALSAAAKIAPSRDAADPSALPLRSPASPPDGGFARMLSRTATSASANMPPPPPTPVEGRNGGGGSTFWQPNDIGVVHQQIVQLANKRIATLDYLRRTHGGRVYWFNSYLFDKTDLSRMPCFDPRRLARKATNYLLLGLSLPVLVDLYSSTPLEFLRSLSTLLSEFDSFQQLRNDSSASLTRARLPNMFRRPGTKSRRSTSAADATVEEAAAASGMTAGGGGGGGMGGLSPGASAPSVMNFAASESDLLPGEEYAYLLTPSLPFEPDYFETFATLCDALIECYTRFLTMVPTPRECTAPVAELFTKADARVRKIIVQGIVKEFEDSTRANVKTEVASIGKVVLSGLM